jgi:hypothetical protein
MCAFPIVVLCEVRELVFEIALRPERHVIKKLAPNSANQTLDERMGDRNVRDCFDFIDLEDSKIGLPAMEFEQGVMIGAQ